MNKRRGNEGVRVYKQIACGGTFDRLHRGHEALLTTAFALGEKVSIGITEDSFVKGKPEAKMIQDLTTREANLNEWLKSKGLQNRHELVPIKDRFGLAAKSREYEAIIVSPETLAAATEINLQRQKRGLLPLTVITVPMVLAKDGQPISSTRIRKGLIDREGNVIKRVEARHPIRRHIVEILSNGPQYGYQIHKKYRETYGPVSLRLVYYHLGRGVKEGLFREQKREKAEHGYSWGPQAVRIYYELA